MLYLHKPKDLNTYNRTENPSCFHFVDIFRIGFVHSYQIMYLSFHRMYELTLIFYVNQVQWQHIQFTVLNHNTNGRWYKLSAIQNKTFHVNQYSDRTSSSLLRWSLNCVSQLWLEALVLAETPQVSPVKQSTTSLGCAARCHVGKKTLLAHSF